MRRVADKAFGVPADVLRLADRPGPDPGPGEIRARMLLSPTHTHVLWKIRGRDDVKPPLAAAGGAEAVGVADKPGEGVTARALGPAGDCGVRRRRPWAERRLVRAAAAMPAPDAMKRRGRPPAHGDAAVGDDGAGNARR
jgi:NADPH2:quinone reductase